MLSLAARSEPIGYVSANGRALSPLELSDLVGKNEIEIMPLLAELEENHVFSRDRKGRIYNRRMVRDEKARVLAVKNGKKGGNPKLLQQPDNITGNPQPLSDPDNGDPSTPIPLPLPKKKDSPSLPSGELPRERKNPAFSIAEAWEPGEYEITYAKSKGYDDGWIAEHGERFRDYHLKHASRFADWRAAWRNWVQNAADFARSPKSADAGRGRYEPESILAAVSRIRVPGDV
jgi:hypothetical protein